MAIIHCIRRRGLLYHILPLYIARAVIDAIEPLGRYRRTVATWASWVETHITAFRDDYVTSAPEFAESSICNFVTYNIIQPLEFQPKANFCRRLSQCIFWSSMLFLAGCLLRFIWLLPLWSTIRRESQEFWHALFSIGLLRISGNVKA